MARDKEEDDLNEVDDEEGREDLVDNDEMNGSEQGFLQGYDEVEEDKEEDDDKTAKDEPEEE